MLQRRGLLVIGGGLCLWTVARVAGSPVVHIVSVGVVLLPLVAALFARRGASAFGVKRRISPPVVSPGQSATVELEVQNRATVPASLLLVEDGSAPELGRPVRMVLAGIPARSSQTVTYQVSTHIRGRHLIGPLTLDVSDPFALTRRRVSAPERSYLTVVPEVETLSGTWLRPFGVGEGRASSRWLLRTGDEFSAMREYQEGDDLRRIHWPSVARTGTLMIRQDESTRRSAATLLLDTRTSALGRAYGPGFEKGVSVAASIGVLLIRSGFVVRIATADSPPFAVEEDQMLETLASVRESGPLPLSSSLHRLRRGPGRSSTLVVVTGPPPPTEVSALTRATSSFGSRLAVFVYPAEPERLGAELRERASSARLSLLRSGWDVFVLSPDASLRDVWNRNRKTRTRVGA